MNVILFCPIISNFYGLIPEKLHEEMCRQWHQQCCCALLCCRWQFVTHCQSNWESLQSSCVPTGSEKTSEKIFKSDLAIQGYSLLKFHTCNRCEPINIHNHNVYFPFNNSFINPLLASSNCFALRNIHKAVECFKYQLILPQKQMGVILLLWSLLGVCLQKQ